MLVLNYSKNESLEKGMKTFGYTNFNAYSSFSIIPISRFEISTKVSYTSNHYDNLFKDDIDTFLDLHFDYSITKDDRMKIGLHINNVFNNTLDYTANFSNNKFTNSANAEFGRRFYINFMWRIK